MLLHFRNPIYANNRTYNLHQKSVSLLQSIFTYLFHPYLYLHHPYNPHKYSRFLYLRNISPLYFHEQPSQQSAPKIVSLPQPFIQFRLRQGTRKLGSIVETDIVLVSHFFLKMFTVITGLEATDSLSLRLRKLVYYR